MELHVQVPYRVKVALLLERLFHKIDKYIFLGAGRQRQGSPEQSVGQICVQIAGVFCVVDQAVDVCLTVREGREQETGRRHADDPVAQPVDERQALGVKGESRFGERHGTDAAHDKCVHLV